VSDMDRNISVSGYYNYMEPNELALPDHPELGNNPHPQKAMAAMGITYKFALPQSISDSWTFFGCENIPETLPKWATVSEVPREKNEAIIAAWSNQGKATP